MSREERDTSGRIITPTPGTTSTLSEVERRSTVAGPVTWEEMRALLRREPTVYERTWRPTTGGLLSILAGVWNLIIGIGAVSGGTFLTDFVTDFNTTLADALAGIGVGVGIALIVLGLISIIGGVYALSRRAWPMVLAGSITASFPSPVLIPTVMGIFSLIFNVLGHKEFWGPREYSKDYQSNVEHNIDKSR